MPFLHGSVNTRNGLRRAIPGYKRLTCAISISSVFSTEHSRCSHLIGKHLISALVVFISEILQVGLLYFSTPPPPPQSNRLRSMKKRLELLRHWGDALYTSVAPSVNNWRTRSRKDMLDGFASSIPSNAITFVKTATDPTRIIHPQSKLIGKT